MSAACWLDPARVELLASLRAETTLWSVVLGNVRGICLVGTASVVSAAGFRLAFPPRRSQRPGITANPIG